MNTQRPDKHGFVETENLTWEKKLENIELLKKQNYVFQEYFAQIEAAQKFLNSISEWDKVRIYLKRAIKKSLKKLVLKLTPPPLRKFYYVSGDSGKNSMLKLQYELLSSDEKMRLSKLNLDEEVRLRILFDDDNNKLYVETAKLLVIHYNEDDFSNQICFPKGIAKILNYNAELYKLNGNKYLLHDAAYYAKMHNNIKLARQFKIIDF